MTNQEINEAIKDPSKLNELVARKLMPDEIIISSRVKDYCHSIEAAWEIVEHLETEYNIVVANEIGEWLVNISHEENGFPVAVTAATAPMAIALAFLKLP